MAGTLYVVATPIGNLADMSERAVKTLRDVAVVCAEDTRVSSKLLSAYDIVTPLESFHQHSSQRRTEYVIRRLEAGDDIALVSDAGTPGINDPGGMLIRDVVERVPDCRIVPVPGPNAAIAALSVSGFPADRYRYLGFVPLKKGRNTFFADVAGIPETVVFYESKHRVLRTLSQLADAMDAAGTPERPVMAARELTKQFETLYRGSARHVLAGVSDDRVLGEFVVVVGPRPKS